MLVNAKVVEKCPVARATKGRLTLVPQVVAALAGAMEAEPEMEWAAWLIGKRSGDGLDVKVTGVEVPRDQVRMQAHVHVPVENVVPDGCVGVVHSHHGMGAWFSAEDKADLNEKYPVSLVVAVPTEDVKSVWLGWSGLAEGKVTLPCGAMGRVEFDVAVEGSPGMAQPEPRWGVDDGELGDCCHKVARESDVPLFDEWKGKCGAKNGELKARKAAWGRSREIADVLPPPALRVVVSKEGKPANTRYKNLTENEVWARFEVLDGMKWSEMTDAEYEEHLALEEILFGRKMDPWLAVDDWQEQWMAEHWDVLERKGRL